MVAKFTQYAKDNNTELTRSFTVQKSVGYVTDVVDKTTMETKGGGFVGHYGAKVWL